MPRRHLLFILLAAWPGYAKEPAGLSKQECAALGQKLRQLESRLRDGHSARQGRKMKRRVRELQLRRYRGCR